MEDDRNWKQYNIRYDETLLITILTIGAYIFVYIDGLQRNYEVVAIATDVVKTSLDNGCDNNNITDNLSSSA